MNSLIFYIFVFLSPNLAVALEISSQEYREVDFVADHIFPKDFRPKSEIVVTFGGSEGGVNTKFGKLLAERGYRVYALGYFDVAGTNLPKHLVQIPIEYFENAIKKIKALHPNEKCCSLIGGSKGAEAILTYASLSEEHFENIILLSGADRVLEGLGERNMPAKKSSWTYKGKDVPFTPLDGLSFMEFFKLALGLFKTPPQLKPMYLRSIDNPSTGANGLLPVENINSKILFLSGEADNLWPSTLMGLRLEQQLKNKGKTNTITHVSYPKVGHAIVGASQALLKKENQIFLGGELEASKIVEQKAFSMILKTLN